MLLVLVVLAVDRHAAKISGSIVSQFWFCLTEFGGSFLPGILRAHHLCGGGRSPFSLNHSAHCLIYILHLQSNLVDNLVFCSLTDWLVKADANVLLSFSAFFHFPSPRLLNWALIACGTSFFSFSSPQTCTCHWHCCSIALGHFFWPSIQTL